MACEGGTLIGALKGKRVEAESGMKVEAELDVQVETYMHSDPCIA